MKNQRNGFTLLELLVALGILATLTAVASPAFFNWSKNARYRESANQLTAALREGRTRAISSNFEHRVEVDLARGLFRITRGNRAEGSTPASFSENVILGWTPFSTKFFKAGENCDLAASGVKFGFNPNGTSSAKYICIMDEEWKRRFQVGVQNWNTGKIIARR